MNETALLSDYSNYCKRVIWRAALYCRLSQDDEQSGDSVSIQNQKKILRVYAENHEMIIVDEYIDDGWSGTNFKRPAFQKMISDIKSKKINCIITKDLSRLGRNYIEVGYYLENYFPSNGIRYIAVNDNVDTNNGDSDIAPFMNIFNEFHAKQTSKKLRQVYEAQSEEGIIHYIYPPIGYLKNPENKNQLIPDDESAWIVQKIFELADEKEMGAFSLRRWLYENRIPNPGYREYEKWGGRARTYANADEDRRYEWTLQCIKNLLKNKVYIGHTVRYKERTISYKNKTRIKNSPDKWKIVKNTHEPLISEDRFNRVQKLMQSRRRKTGSGEISLFSGIVVCSDCGRLMAFCTRKSKTYPEYQYLYCASKNYTIKKCSMHYVRFDSLQEVVLNEIKKIYGLFEFDKNELVNKLIKLNCGKLEDCTESNNREIKKLEEKSEEIKRLLIRLYEDWVSNKINEKMFSMMSQKYQDEQERIDLKLNDLKSSVNKSNQKEYKVEKWLELIKKYSCPNELTRDIITALIDKIVVYETTGKRGDKNRTQKIDIYWKFIGCLDEN